MPYAALADVQVALGKHKVALTTTSNPSESDVTSKILPAISGVIDAVLSGRGITVPVTSPTLFVDKLKDLEALGAAARVDAALYPQAAGPASTNFAQWLQNRFDEGLEALRRGEGVPDTAVMAGTSLPTSFHQKHAGTKGTDHDNATADNTTDPVFRRDSAW